jgi:hypothetical protein
MQTSKIGCMQCPEYGECPKKTRLFINYCGSRKETVLADIRSAVLDCHTRRVTILKQMGVARPSPVPKMAWAVTP